MRSGLSLMEVIVGMALLGMVMTAVVMFQSQTTKLTRINLDFAALTRALATIERDIMREMPFIPPQAQDDPQKDSIIFQDPNRAGLACYDHTGARLPDCNHFENNRLAFARVQFFKARVADESVDPQSPLGHIPVSRVRFRVVYKLNWRVQPPYFFSRIMTDVLKY